MISTVRFRNFRGFHDLTLDGLRRLNLIVGNNGSGKTALMEGVSLAAGNTPHIALLLRRFRGLPMPGAGGSVPHLLALFDDLFYRFDTKTPVDITLTGTREDKTFSRGLTIARERVGQITVPLNTPGGETPMNSGDIFRSPVLFEWRHAEGNGEPEHFKTVPRITQTSVQLEVGGRTFPLAFLPARGFFDGAAAAEGLTYLDRENKASKFADTMRKLFPDIESVSVAYEQNVGQLWVKARNLDKKYSISLLSDGAGHISQVLLAIAQNAGGFVLIDEIENGFYFERYGDVLRAIDEFSKEFGTQVFFTTHSDAILDAFHEHVADKTEDFSIIRCFREESGGTNARIISGERAERALRSGIELRV